MAQEQKIYEAVGGQQTFARLAEAFYARIERDPLLRPMYPRHLNCAIRHLGAFLAQFFGGPPEYNALRGSPQLKMRHKRFYIGQAERDAWVANMLGALDDVGIDGPARQAMEDYFTSTASFLIN